MAIYKKQNVFKNTCVFVFLPPVQGFVLLPLRKSFILHQSFIVFGTAFINTLLIKFYKQCTK